MQQNKIELRGSEWNKTEQKRQNTREVNGMVWKGMKQNRTEQNKMD